MDRINAHEIEARARHIAAWRLIDVGCRAMDITNRRMAGQDRRTLRQRASTVSFFTPIPKAPHVPMANAKVLDHA